MASISASLPSFLHSCFGLRAKDTAVPQRRAPQEHSDASSQEPHLGACAAMAQSGPLGDLYKGASHSRKNILQSTELKDHFDTLAKGQSPKYYVIACSDSRVSPPEIFRVRPGSMFEMQQLGALMPAVPTQAIAPGGSIDSEWANVSFAVRELKVQHLIILGHTGCGAVAGIMAPEAISHNPEVAAHLAKHKALRERVNARFGGLSVADKSLAAVGESVLHTLEKVRAFAPVKEALQQGSMQLHAMVYEIANHGAISEWDDNAQEFVIKNAEKKNDVSILPRRSGGSSVA